MIAVVIVLGVFLVLEQVLLQSEMAENRLINFFYALVHGICAV